MGSSFDFGVPTTWVVYPAPNSKKPCDPVEGVDPRRQGYTTGMACMAAREGGAVFHIGTSGWQYADWRNTFYPRGLPQSRWLEHYTTIFSTVEVNATFYRLPREATFADWRNRTPAGFTFAVKASRYLTHVRRLRDPEEPASRLLTRSSALGPRLGPVLVQLPPTLPADLPALTATLERFRSVKVAVEFRHPSWFTEPGVKEVLDRLGVAWVWADRPGDRTAKTLTGGWAYVRFHRGTAAGFGYRRSKLRRWADRLRSLEANEVFVYFNNDHGAAAPRDALTFRDLLLDRGSEVIQVGRAPGQSGESSTSRTSSHASREISSSPTTKT
jgi:uncharacterized protein YecE (DUF72 family)